MWAYSERTHIKHHRKPRAAWFIRLDFIHRRVSTKHDELASDRMACVATHLHDVKGVGNINPTKHPTIRFRSLASKLFGGGEDYMKDGMVSTQISAGPSSGLLTSCPPYIHKSCVPCSSSLTSTEQNLVRDNGFSPSIKVAVCVDHWFLSRSKNLIFVKSNFQGYLS